MTKPDAGAGAPSSGPDVHSAAPMRDTGRSDGPQGEGGHAEPRSPEVSAQPDTGQPPDDPFAKRPSKRGRRRRRGRGGSNKPADEGTPVVARGVRTGHDAAGRNDDGAKAPKAGPVGRVQKPAIGNGSTGDGSAGSRPDQNTSPRDRPAAPAVRRSHTPKTAYAALDLGTNNCRLLVAVPTRPGMFRVVDAFSRIVRLGEGLGASGQLSDEAMDRAVEALAVCRDKLTARPIERTRLIATEACRSAENGAAFLDRVRDQTGLKLEVVDRETEARLAVSGCGSLVDRAARSTVLFDIGGGSSEIAILDLDRHRPRNLSDNIVAWTSLPVGVVTMAERFGGRHVDEESFAAMVDHAEELLAGFAETRPLARHDADDAFHLIGTSGTVTTLAGIHLGLERYDRRRVDGLWMRDHEVDHINDKLLSWSFDERVANPCIGRDRADLVLAGCAILQAIRKVWPARRLRVADRGLREGILTEMMAADGVWRRSRYRRGRSGARK